MGDFYIKYEYWFAVFQLVLAMLGMGATLTIKDFKEILLEPKAVTLGSLIQLVMVPVIAFVFISVFGLVGGVAVGVALIAAIPGGSTSNIFTHLTNGNVALSITITALTTLACLVTTPVILELLISNYLPQDFVMPKGKIMQEIALNLLLPLAAGMLYLRVFPKSAEVFSKWCVRASMFGMLMIFIGASLSGRLDVDAFGRQNMLLIVGLAFVLMFANRLVSRGLRLSERDRTAIDFEVVVRNGNLGLMIKASLFPAVVGVADPLGDMVLFSVLLYGGFQMLMAFAIVGQKRFKLRSVAAESNQNI